MAASSSSLNPSPMIGLAAKIQEEFTTPSRREYAPQISDLTNQLSKVKGTERKPLKSEVKCLLQDAKKTRETVASEKTDFTPSDLFRTKSRKKLSALLSKDASASTQSEKNVKVLTRFKTFIKENHDAIVQLQNERMENPARYSAEIEQLKRAATSEVVSVIRFIAEANDKEMVEKPIAYDDDDDDFNISLEDYLLTSRISLKELNKLDDSRRKINDHVVSLVLGRDPIEDVKSRPLK